MTATGVPTTDMPTSTTTFSRPFKPTSTVTTTSTPGIPAGCPPVKQELEPGFLAEGEIVFYDRDQNELFSLSSSDREVQPFLNQLSLDIYSVDSFSPDHQWLAIGNARYDAKGYYLGTDLVITNSSGEETKIIPWDERWIHTSFGWLDNERLIMIPLAEAERGTIILFNPFTSQQQEIRHSFPNLYDDTLYNSHFWNFAHVVYDPSLTRVVYLSNDGGASIILWDVETQRELWRFTDLTMASRPPVWLPGGKHFVFIAPTGSNGDHFEFRLVSRDGQMRRLIDQAFLDDTAEIFVLSPDGRYLAFGEGPSYGEQRLVLVDLTTQQIVNYCITDHPGVRLPVWSLDSKQFVVFHQNPTYNLLVDVASNTVTQLDIGFTPVGWLTVMP